MYGHSILSVCPLRFDLGTAVDDVVFPVTYAHNGQYNDQYHALGQRGYQVMPKVEAGDGWGSSLLARMPTARLGFTVCRWGSAGIVGLIYRVGISSSGVVDCLG
jgi:hypothetical protein